MVSGAAWRSEIKKWPNGKFPWGGGQKNACNRYGVCVGVYVCVCVCVYMCVCAVWMDISMYPCICNFVLYLLLLCSKNMCHMKPNRERVCWQHMCVWRFTPLPHTRHLSDFFAGARRRRTHRSMLSWRMHLIGDGKMGICRADGLCCHDRRSLLSVCVYVCVCVC